MVSIDVSNNPLAKNILAAVFVLVGFVVVIVGLWNIVLGAKSKNWPRATAKILSSEVERHRTSKGGTTYGAEIHYEYHVNGIKYANNKLSFGDYQSGSPSRAQRIENKYPEGQQFSVFYDPANPERAVLEPGVRWMQVLVVLFGAVFFAAGVFVFLTV